MAIYYIDNLKQYMIELLKDKWDIYIFTHIYIHLHIYTYIYIYIHIYILSLAKFLFQTLKNFKTNCIFFLHCRDKYLDLKNLEIFSTSLSWFERVNDIFESLLSARQCSTLYMCMRVCKVTQLCQTLCTLWTVASQAPLSMGCSGKNTGMGCHFLLQGSSRPKDQTCFYVSCISRQVLYHKRYLRSPILYVHQLFNSHLKTR